jgi:hypothetical protein
LLMILWIKWMKVVERIAHDSPPPVRMERTRPSA